MSLSFFIFKFSGQTVNNFAFEILFICQDLTDPLLEKNSIKKEDEKTVRKKKKQKMKILRRKYNKLNLLILI